MTKADELYQSTGSYLNESMTRRPAGGDLGGASAISLAEMTGRKRHNGAAVIDIDRIIPDPDQPRKDFEKDALERLAHSLKTKGQLQPIRVRWDAVQERYVVIAGERRFRASQLAGLKTLDCIVHDKTLSDDEKLEVQLIENCVREDLNPIEEARAYRELMSKKGWKQGDLAEALKLHRTTVVKALSLLKLPEDVQAEVAAGKIPPAVAREVAKLETEEEQRAILVRYHKEGLSSDDAAKHASESKRGGKGKAAAKSQAAAKKFTRSWPGGIKVTVSTKKKESMAIVAQCLREWADAILEDGRTAKNAA